MNHLFVYTFYRFKNLDNLNETKNTLSNFFKNSKIKGTILISNEGINGSLSGSRKELDASIKLIKNYLKIKKLDLKINNTKFIPFNKIRIRIKKEIVSLGQGIIDVNKYSGKLVDPKDWDRIILDKDTKLIDVRNEFEIGIGKFKNSINPKTNSFREFPDSISKLEINKNDKIAMYCTGGIRCEKASAFLKISGYRNVYQLKGGIINYLKYKKNSTKDSLWNGECFVFDGRVTINKKLNKGRYFQCYGCRRPITKKDLNSPEYKKGVSCPHCVNERTAEQKFSSLTRQRQIERAEKKKEDHTFKMISL